MLSLSPPTLASTMLRSPAASPSSPSSSSSSSTSRLSPPSAATPRSNAPVTPEYSESPTTTSTVTASPSTSPSATARPSAPSLSPSRMHMRASVHVSGELLRPPRPGPAFQPLSPILSPSIPPAPSTTMDPNAVDYINNNVHHHQDDRPMDDMRLLSTPDFGSSPDLTLPAATALPVVDVTSANGAVKHKRPPLFHIPTNSTSDNEDDDPPSAAAAGPSRHPSRISLVDPGVDSSPAPVVDVEKEAAKRHIRQSHALLELLSTEQAYLTDLRILVSIYLRNLDIFGPQPKATPKSATQSKSSRPKTPTSHSHHGHGTRDSNSHLSYAFHSSLVMPSFVRQVSPGPAQSSSKPLPKPPSDEKPAPLSTKTGKSGHSRASSVPQAPALSTITLNTPLPTQVETPAPLPPSDEKPHKRSSPPSNLNLLTHSEILTIRSNASALLTLHQSFSDTLSRAISPFPSLSHSSSSEGIRDAISAVAKAFITSAPSFGVYEAYCARHPDAQDIVRRLMGKHPAEWRAYEILCARQAAELVNGPTPHPAANAEGENTPIGTSRPVSPARAHTSEHVFTSTRTRRHSLPSLALVSRIKPSDLLAPVPGQAQAQASTPTQSTSGPKLAFLDYLIKPVQRICRYPLLLDALSRTSSPAIATTSTDDGRPRRRDSTSAHGTFSLLGGSMRSPAENAGQVMRGVVLAVDDARSKREMLARGARIASRLVLPGPSAAPVGIGVGGGDGEEGEERKMRAPTPAFVSSLGPCVLAGAVDVLLHSRSNVPSALNNASPMDGTGEVTASSSVVHVKYLGAFLYKGGWMLLVKVKRAGLEPKHWIPLARAEVDDVEDIEGGLPNTIRIRFAGHALDLITACKREKEVWLDTMLETRAVERSARMDWMDEPVCSLSLLQGKRPPALQILPPMPTSAREEEDMPLSPDDVLSDVRSLCTAESGITSLGGSHAHSAIHGYTHGAFAPQIQPVRQHSGGSTGASPSSGPPTSRRSSLLFLSNAFSPSSGSSSQNASSSASTGITVRRTPSHSRSAVDRALGDIFSPSIMDARYRAQAADEVLWPASTTHGAHGGGASGSGTTPRRNAFSRSGSALRIGGRTDTVVFRRGASSGDILAASFPTANGTANATPMPNTPMSATVPMNREPSSHSTVVPPTPTPASMQVQGQVETTTPTRPTPTRSQSARWRAPRSLMITPIVDWALSEDGHGQGHGSRARSATVDSNMGGSSAFAVATSPTEEGHGARSDSPDLLSASACSSHGHHGHGQVLSPPFALARLAPPMVVTAPNTMADRPKRTRSLVDNLRGIFTPRSPSTTSTSSANATPTVVIYAPDGPPLAPASGPGPGSPARVRWWSKGSLRRRVKSAPDAPEDEHHHRGVATAPGSTSDLLMAAHAATVLGHGSGDGSANGSMSRPAPPVRRRSVFARFAEMRAVVPASTSTGAGEEVSGNVPASVPAQSVREGDEMETTKTAKVRRRQSLKLLFSGSSARSTSPGSTVLAT